MRTTRKWGVTLQLISLLFIGGLGRPFAIAQHAPNSKNAEQYVLKQLAINGEADLGKSGLTDHTLRHEFIEKLMVGGYPSPAISTYGIKISDATIAGRVKVTHATEPFRVQFLKCVFENGLDFSYDSFAHDLSFVGTDFGVPSTDPKNPEVNSAKFVGIKVAETLHLTAYRSEDGDASKLQRTRFYGAVDFTYAEIAKEFISDDVEYRSQMTADFDSMKSTGPVFFRGDQFSGPLDLSDSDLFALYVEGISPFEEGSARAGAFVLDVNQAHFGHTFAVRRVGLNRFQAGFVAVDGPTELEDVVPLGSVDLTHAHFRNLVISGFDRWLQPNEFLNFRLEGLSFDGIEIPKAQAEPSAMRMLELIKSPRSPYSPQPYLELEKFLRSHGNPKEADETYIEMRRKENAQLSILKQPFDWLLDALVGYGRKPWKSGLYALLLVCIGAFIFRRGRMTHDDEGRADDWYNPFWFSLDLLSPIDLGVSKKWRAKSSLIRNYSQLHRIAGWILIPLFAGAITGIIK